MIKSLNGWQIQIAFVHLVHAHFICIIIAKDFERNSVSNCYFDISEIVVSCDRKAVKPTKS